MKKLLVIFLAAMLIVSLAACSNSKTGEKETSAAATSAATSSQTTEESTANSAAFDKQEAVKNLHFGYAGEANIKDTDNGKMVENKDYNTIVSFQEGKTMKELAESRGLTFAEAVKLNGTEWNKYTFKNDNYSTKKLYLSVLVYMFEYIFNIAIIIFLVMVFDVNKIIAPLIAPIFSTPPVFFLMILIMKNK